MCLQPLPQQNQMHTQSTHHCQYLSKQKSHFPEKIRFMLNLVLTRLLLCPTLSANVYYSRSEMLSSSRSFLNNAFRQQIRVTDHISNAWISSRVLKKKVKYDTWFLHYYFHVARSFNMQELGNLCLQHLKTDKPISTMKELTSHIIHTVTNLITSWMNE